MNSRDVQRRNLQKKLLKKIKKGEINAGQAASELKKRGLQPSNKFCKELSEALKTKAEAKAAEIREKEAEKEEKEKKEAAERKRRLEWEFKRDMRQAAEKIQRITEEKNPHLKDNRIWRENKALFDSTVGLLRKGKISVKNAEGLGKELGLQNPKDWWIRYYQHQAGRPYKKKRQKQ